MTIAETGVDGGVDIVGSSGGGDSDGEAASDEAALLDYLRARDVACPLCGYNLRGLTAGRCPECGRGLQLSVGLVEPRIGAWVTCLVAVTTAGGLGVMAVLSLVRHGWDVLFAPGGAVQVVTISYFMASIVLAAAVILLRRRYRRLSQTIQWTLAGVAAGLTVLAFAVLIAGQ